MIPRILRKYFFALIFSAFTLSAGTVGLCTENTSAESLPEVDDTAGFSENWPDIHEVRTRILQQTSDETSMEVLPPRLLPYTQEELSELFGGLMYYYNNGSTLPDDLSLFAPDANNVTQYNGYVLVRRSWDTLQQEIEDMLSGFQGDWSVYLKDLASGKTMEINEHSMESASLIKLYIAGAVYEQIELGNLEESDTVMTALNNMITYSDNESSNVLVRTLCDESGDFQTGLDVVNDFISRHGFTNTQQVNGIADPSLWVSDGRINMTSAADCGHLLEMVYNRELVSHFNSFRFEVLLNKQEVNYKIPAALPENVHISHKTGEVDDTENDTAIIYTPYGDFILCILSTDLTDTGSAVDHIHEITKKVYEYFTEPLAKYTPGKFTDLADTEHTADRFIDLRDAE
ncbi:MAG: serine hydrolase [Eubacteriales bacterium]|nr:serine hydrolase [Eubacteriales bacterium]